MVIEKTLQKDSKSKSLSEAFVNSFGSYPIGYGIGIMILPISMGWLEENLLVANIFITLIYASVSFVRIYYLRRFFERVGFDDNFVRLGIRLFRKVGIKLKLRGEIGGEKSSMSKHECYFGMFEK